MKTGECAGIDRESHTRVGKLLKAYDFDGVREMMRQGRVLDIKEGTSIKVVDQRFLVSEVKILEGPHTGRYVFVCTEFIGGH